MSEKHVYGYYNPQNENSNNLQNQFYQQQQYKDEEVIYPGDYRTTDK